MKKLIPCLIAMILICTCAFAEETVNTIIGGADGPTAIFLSSDANAGSSSITIPLDANITTGFEWSAFVVGGDSVVIDENASGYVSDPNPGAMCGVGGTHYFVINAVKPGESIIRFTYSRGMDEVATDSLMLLTVSDDLQIQFTDVTESGAMTGTVAEVNPDTHTVTLNVDQVGAVIACFTEDTLPVVGEKIRVFTNGTMAMSEPAIVNVLGWESIPTADARSSADTLPPFLYTETDPIEAAAADFAVQMAEKIGYYREEINVTIPAPVILKTETIDDDHVKVYGNFWHLNYTLEDDVLLCVSGGEAPGVLELARDGEGWTVTGYEIADDGEDYYTDIVRFCSGDQALVDQYFTANDAAEEPLKSVRHRFISEYVNLYQLPVSAYQDEGWDPIPLDD